MAGEDEKKEDTRAIARQAVEAEFRKKKNRKRAGYDSSDDEGGAGKQQRNKHNKKSKSGDDEFDNVKKKPTRPLAVWEVKYRDRAKERREGKEPGVADEDVDDDDDGDARSKSAKQSLLDDVFEDDDEQQNGNEPVKGLDRRLVQRQQPNDEDEESSPFVASREEALDFIASADAEHSVSSNLGKEMLSFLRREYLPAPEIKEPTLAGMAVQRSTVIFSTTAIPGIATQAWQVPRQEMAAVSSSTTTVANGANNIVPKISPINDPSLLERMQQLLARQRALEVQQAAAASDVKSGALSKKAMIPQDDDDDDIFQVSDDDEDYFEKISEENKKKPAPVDDETSSHDKKPRKTFFFNNPQPKPDTPAVTAEGSATQSSEQPTKSSMPAAIQKLERFSAMDGGYDDEGNDVDFDGRLEDEEEDEKKKKLKKKRKRKKKNDDDSD